MDTLFSCTNCDTTIPADAPHYIGRGRVSGDMLISCRRCCDDDDDIAVDGALNTIAVLSRLSDLP